MAALSPGKLAVLIERLFEHGFRKPYAVMPNSFSSIRALGAAHVLSGEQIDSIWLQRVELRTAREAEVTLDRLGLDARADTLSALFVDRRCGLICAETIALDAKFDWVAVVGRILRLASGHHADGIMLAINDWTGRVAGGDQYRQMIMALYRKGKAIDVPLLDHFVLTGAGWKSMLSPELAAHL